MSRLRVQLEPAYVLHHRPYRDTSRIVDLLTRDHGRITLFARAVRGAKTRYGAALQAFSALLVSWSGSGDGGTLTSVETAPGAPLKAPPPARLMSGFYLNELCLRLLLREHPQPEIFASYAQAVAGLVSGESEAALLRIFEKRLLEALGMGVDYAHQVSGARVEPDGYYHVPAGRGVLAPARGPGPDCYRGRHLLALAGEALEDAQALVAARRLLKEALAHALEGRELASRGVARAVRARQARAPSKGEP
jgi:DNA repair protein RecO (recombination protein O)